MKEAPAWQQSTKEVAFIVCNKCCRRLEAEIDKHGTAVARLQGAFAQHWKSEHDITGFIVDPRWFREQVKTELIDLDELLDLGDILSNVQLQERARRYRERAIKLTGYRVDLESCQKLVKRRVSGLILRSEKKYICRQCERYITRRMAERGGVGRECHAAANGLA